MVENNAVQQQEELEALQAIFGEDFCRIEDGKLQACQVLPQLYMGFPWACKLVLQLP